MMDYKSIYDRLISKAKNRIPNPQDYYEKHHIVPRSIGGDDTDDNIVKLTYKEHYVAHKLLVEIYPNNKSLVTALWLMTITTDKALEKYNDSYNKNELSLIEYKCLLQRNKNNFRISSNEYAYARQLYIKSMIGHEVNKHTKEKISNNTKNSMHNNDIISKCRKGSLGSKHYYDKETKQRYKWFPGDPDIDLSKYSYGRPKMSNEQKQRLREYNMSNKKTYHNDELQINYVCYLDDIKHMPNGWLLGRKNYGNDNKFKKIINETKFYLIEYGYYLNDDIFIYPKVTNKTLKRKYVLNPSVFIACYDILKTWKNDKNIVEHLANDILNKMDDIIKLNKIFLVQ